MPDPYLENTEMSDSEFKIIHVNGLELKSLKGGFIGYLYNRPARSESSGLVPDRKPEPQPEKETEPADDRNGDSASKAPQFLLCKKCGTVINVFLNDRNARCCNQLMVPLVEAGMTDMAEAENN